MAKIDDLVAAYHDGYRGKYDAMIKEHGAYHDIECDKAGVTAVVLYLRQAFIEAYVYGNSEAVLPGSVWPASQANADMIINQILGDVREKATADEGGAGRDNGGSKETFPPTHCGSTVRAGYEPQPVAVNVANPVASDFSRDSGSDTDPASPSSVTAPAPAVCEWTKGQRGGVTPSCSGLYEYAPYVVREGVCPECKAPIKFTEAK